MGLLVRYTEWADYVGGQLATTEADEYNLNAQLRSEEAILLLREMPDAEALRKREDSMTRVKAEVESAAELKEAREQLAVIYARRKLLNSVYERLDRGAFLLSRELTRRGGTDPKRARANYGKP